MTIERARVLHGVTAVVTWAALLLQLVLVIKGGRILDEVEPPSLGVRLGRYLAYFTIQSNLLVAFTTTMLVRNPARDGHGWRVARLAGVVGIAITGVVHYVALRPLLNLNGADLVADKLLHMVVPVLAVVGWLLAGPRPRIRLREIQWAICWPFAWLAAVLVIGWQTGWYPYPFLDHRLHGTPHVVAACVLVTVLFLAFFGLAAWIDGRARPVPTGTVGA